MKPSSGGGFVGRYFIITIMEKKETKKIQWDEKAVNNFENYLKLMYGEYGKIKVD